MNCSGCDTPNEPDRKYCKACGERLTVTCRSCGAANATDAQFCGQCGSPLNADDTPALPERLAERRLVSVLFADLVGFTSFGESNDPETVREALSAFFTVARGIVERYGGTVEKFIGDAVMAVWGAPQAHEDDAERAVLAGLELVMAVRSVGPGLEARAAVMTGQAAVTLAATGEGFVAGDLVNTAARLQTLAPIGAVVVGAATRRAAERAIEFEPIGAHALKGKTRPVAMWTAGRVHRRGRGPGRGGLAELPLIGRDDQVRLLRDLLHATVRERRARLVSIVGAAGVGKTRLAGELADSTAGLDPPVLWLSGRSPAYGGSIAFWALGEMVRQRAGLAEGADEPTTRGAVEVLLDELGAHGDDRAWIEPALLTLLGAAAPTVDPKLLASAWRTVFERLAARSTVALVFEDLHWADVGLLEFVEDLVDWARDVPLFVVTIARPELLDQRPDWGVRRHSFTSLVLDPLSDGSMRRLVEGLLPAFGSREIDAIVNRSEGIPLYAVELARMQMPNEGDEPIALAPSDAMSYARFIPIPETLTALVAARLDALPSDERGVILDASVLGQTFTVDALRAISGGASLALDQRLRRLVRRELLALELDPRSPERGQYAFVQSLVREVAYGTLARRDRRDRHLAAADHFASLGSDEIAAVLANHYLAAMAGAEIPAADPVAPRAVAAIRAAADRAGRLGTHAQAADFYYRAAGLATDPREAAGLTQSAGEAASVAGRHEDASRHLKHAREAWSALGDRSSAAYAATRLGRALLNAQRFDEARQVLDAAAVEFADLAGQPAMAPLRGELVRAAFLNDDDAAALTLADQVISGVDGIADPATLADTLVTKGSLLGLLGDTDAGVALLITGEAAAEAAGLTHTQLRAIGNRSIIEDHRDPHRALDLARTGLALAIRRGDRSVSANLLHTAAWAARRTGDWSWAAEQLSSFAQLELESSDRLLVLSAYLVFPACRGDPVADPLAEIEGLAARRGDKFGRQVIHVARATAAFAGGDLEAAHIEWRLATEINPGYAPIAFEDAGRAALWLDDLDSTRLDLADLMASSVRAPLRDAIAGTLEAGVAALEGRRAEALRGYRASLRRWKEMRLPWNQALCAIDMATLLGTDDRSVAAAVDEGRRILRELEAKPFLDRLERAARGGGSEAGRST